MLTNFVSFETETKAEHRDFGHEAWKQIFFFNPFLFSRAKAGTVDCFPFLKLHQLHFPKKGLKIWSLFSFLF